MLGPFSRRVQTSNFPTKKHWRKPSKLAYIDNGLKKFVDQYEERGIWEIAFPRLGCGNGGLDWADVAPLMEHHLKPLPIPVYIHWPSPFQSQSCPMSILPSLHSCL